MKIFEKDGRIHLQLMNLTLGKMLFDFSVEKPHFEELRSHMIERLKTFKLPEDDLNCPDCKFNDDKKCNNIGIVDALCETVACEFKMNEPYIYPKKEE